MCSAFGLANRGGSTKIVEHAIYKNPIEPQNIQIVHIPRITRKTQTHNNTPNMQQKW